MQQDSVLGPPAPSEPPEPPISALLVLCVLCCTAVAADCLRNITHLAQLHLTPEMQYACAMHHASKPKTHT